MVKESTKNKILEHAGKMIRMKGFNNTGIQEILDSAGVPKGSFYFYFKSKEDLGLALIDHFEQSVGQLGESLLVNASGSPLERLRGYFEAMRLFFEQDGWKGGCPIGNLTQEMGPLNEAFRTKLRAVFRLMQSGIRDCLEQAKAANELDSHVDVDETSEFILDSWEGAIVRMKAEGNSAPLLLFQKIVFEKLLRR